MTHPLLAETFAAMDKQFGRPADQRTPPACEASEAERLSPKGDSAAQRSDKQSSEQSGVHHTPGLIFINAEVGETVLYVDERQIAECFEDGQEQTAEDEANAKRIVACWRAFDGVPTEQIEDDAFKKMREDRDTQYVRLQKVRAELLAEIDGAEESKYGDQMLSRLIRFCDGESF